MLLSQGSTGGCWDLERVCGQSPRLQRWETVLIPTNQGKSWYIIQLLLLSLRLYIHLLLAYSLWFPGGQIAFREFLKSEYSEENILFWLACEEYKKIKTVPEMISSANRIYSEFVQTEAPKQVTASCKNVFYLFQHLQNMHQDIHSRGSLTVIWFCSDIVAVGKLCICAFNGSKTIEFDFSARIL